MGGGGLGPGPGLASGCWEVNAGQMSRSAFWASPRGEFWSLCHPGTGLPASWNPSDPRTRGRAGRAVWHGLCPPPGPGTSLSPADIVCPGQASWRGWPPWPSTMESTAPHSRCPTWGPWLPLAQAGRPWCGPSSLLLRSCCVVPAVRHPPGSVSDHAGGRARWAGRRWCGAGGSGSAGSRPGPAGRSCLFAAPCGWPRCGPAAPGGCT